MFGFGRKRWDKQNGISQEISRSGLPRNRRLRPRNFGKQLPDQLRAARGSTDPQVYAIGVDLYTAVMNPLTGQPWQDGQVKTATTVAVARALDECQQEALDLSEPEDKLAQRQVHAAAEAIGVAEAKKDEADRFFDETVVDAGETRCSARQAWNAHQADRALAAEREADGDTEHSRKPLEFAWIIVGALVFAFLDMLLLWRPILGLDFVRSAPMLLNWTIAIVLTVAQAMFLAIALRIYRERERESRDRRDALLDHNRAVRHEAESNDLTAVARRNPDARQLAVADHKLVVAQYVLLLAAITLGVIAAIRVALLARRDGDQSVLEATVYGALVGLILGGLVLLLGWLSCRGNRLGDRLRAGARVAADIVARRDRLRREVEAARDAADDALRSSRTASNDAKVTREWVVHMYGRAILLAGQWLRLDQPPRRPDNLVQPRELHTAEQVSKDQEAVAERLKKIDSWLDNWKPTPAAARSTAIVRIGPNPREERIPWITPPGPGELGGEVDDEVNVPDPPQVPPWLMLVGAGVAVLAAFLAAYLVPDPADSRPSVQAVAGAMGPAEAHHSPRPSV